MMMIEFHVPTTTLMASAKVRVKVVEQIIKCQTRQVQVYKVLGSTLKY